MRVAFALLVDETAHNLLRKWALDAHRRFRTGFLAAHLPPHVSLKQPFPVHDLPPVEAYFDRLATSLVPISITLTRLDVRHTLLSPTEEHVILWADVRETPDLRALHERLNVELASQFGDTAAPFDGPGYHFHATVSLAVHPSGTQQALRQAYAATPIAYTFVATQLALFYYDDESFAPASYLTYKIARVGPHRAQVGAGLDLVLHENEIEQHGGVGDHREIAQHRGVSDHHEIAQHDDVGDHDAGQHDQHQQANEREQDHEGRQQGAE
jgi:2'-5' RNA ligase